MSMAIPRIKISDDRLGTRGKPYAKMKCPQRLHLIIRIKIGLYGWEICGPQAYYVKSNL
jgi:hypothetical protein